MAVFDMNSIDFNIDTVKILGMHFSYNKNVLKKKKFWTSFSSIENVLKPYPWSKIKYKVIQINQLNTSNLLIFGHRLIKQNRVMTIDQLTKKETYLCLLSKIKVKPTSQVYFEKFFLNDNIKWDEVYILPRMSKSQSIFYLKSYSISKLMD